MGECLVVFGHRKKIASSFEGNGFSPPARGAGVKGSMLMQWTCSTFGENHVVAITSEAPDPTHPCPIIACKTGRRVKDEESY